MKKYSMSLLIKEMQLKTTLNYPLTPAEWLLSINQQSAGKDVENRKPSCTLAGNAGGAATVENSVGFPQRIKEGNYGLIQ